MPSNVKTYDGSDDPEDHLKNFQAAAKVERWAMPTWCHGNVELEEEEKKMKLDSFLSRWIQFEEVLAVGCNLPRV
ncbi:hypothetical protein Tco_0854353 [Tanacetum coccineum]